MNSLVRPLLALLALAALGSAVLPHPAAAALRELHHGSSDLKNTCIGRRFPIVGQADTLVRAGRITFVQTTLAFARVIKHEALAYDRAAGTARPGGR